MGSLPFSLDVSICNCLWATVVAHRVPNVRDTQLIRTRLYTLTQVSPSYPFSLHHFFSSIYRSCTPNFCFGSGKPRFPAPKVLIVTILLDNQPLNLLVQFSGFGMIRPFWEFGVYWFWTLTRLCPQQSRLLIGTASFPFLRSPSCRKLLALDSDRGRESGHFQSPLANVATR